MPLAARILVAVVLGVLAARVGGSWIAPLGDLGMLVIRLLKTLAAPLILFAIVDAFLRFEIPTRQGLRLLALSAINAVVAIGIGLGVAHVLHAGSSWQGRITSLLAQVARPGEHVATKGSATLDPVSNLGQYIPESIVEPFANNRIITIVVLAVALGIALRRLEARGDDELTRGVRTIATLARVAQAALTQWLEWVVVLVPFAVFGIVASVVARTGVQVFAILAPFLATILLGLALHAFGYYALMLWAVARRSPWRFFAGALDAITTALSSGSSLATLPVTLRCLNDKLAVSPSSARLAALVGTNLNHDGIILYEAAAAIFVAHAFGYSLGVGQQVTIAFAAVMAGVGIAGVPEAGLITLPLVLGAARLPEAVVATVIPLLLPVDWIIGRARAMTNVLSDMTVAAVLDRMDARAASVDPTTVDHA